MKMDIKILVPLRMVMAGIMLWAFFDKVFGLGFSTSPDQAWLNGISPTKGFLQFGVDGYLADVFNSMAGNVVIDWLFMMGLLGVGMSMLLGIGMKVGGYSGALMMFLLWLASIPPEHNPILDEHVVYLLVFWGLGRSSVGDVWGMGKWWKETELVKRFGWLV